MGKLSNFLNLRGCSGESREDCSDIGSLLHGNDPELILLVDPDEEGLGSIVEDTSALGPVSLHASSDEVLVSRHKEEVVVDELLPHFLVHPSERVIGAGKVALSWEYYNNSLNKKEIYLEIAKGSLHEALHFQTLLLSDSRAEAKSRNASSDPSFKM